MLSNNLLGTVFLGVLLGLLGWLDQTADAAAEPAPVSRVVLISVDGLRADAIAVANARHMLDLSRQGLSCTLATTVRPSLTLPSHASMLTGLEPDHHGVWENGPEAGRIEVPTLFALIKRHGMEGGFIVSKPKMGILLEPGTAGYEFVPGTGQKYASCEKIVEEFKAAWKSGKYPFIFVHISDPDKVGHKKGWMSAAYLDAVREADLAVGRIVAAIQESREANRTAIILTADHGGSGKFHLKNIDANNRIPWICVGPGVPVGETLERAVRTLDTTPTILRLLGLPIPDGLDGHPVDEVFGPRVKSRATGRE